MSDTETPVETEDKPPRTYPHALDAAGYIVSEDGVRTNVDGVFVAGDVYDIRYKQAVTAAGMGCKAAIDAEKYLESLEVHHKAAVAV